MIYRSQEVDTGENSYLTNITINKHTFACGCCDLQCVYQVRKLQVFTLQCN